MSDRAGADSRGHEFLSEVVPESPLLSKLLNTARGEPVSLRVVVAAALFDPENGYYTKNIRTVGRRGDFTTTPELSSVLGCAVAEWLRRNRKFASNRGRSHFIELGAGTGELMRQIRKSLGLLAGLRWNFSIVDISEPLKALQAQKLGTAVRWYHDAVASIGDSSGCALMLGHEFVDAFPPKVAQFRNGKWRELMLARDAAGKVRFCLGNTDFSELAKHFLNPCEGQRVELPVDFCEWLARVRPSLRRTKILLIDYGGTTQEIYVRRKQGTLRSYSHHQRCEGADALARLGKCDITCDVDFSYIMREAMRMSLEVRPLHTFYDFVNEHTKSKDFLNSNPRLLEICEMFRCLELCVG